MHLLLQLFRDLVEAKLTGSLQQHQFVAQTAKGIAGEEMLHIGEEAFVIDTDLICLRRYLGADADKLVDAALHSQVAHLGIERLGSNTTLEDVTEDERLSLRLTTVHEVEGDIQRVDVAVVGVVDQDTAALPFLHFQTHGHRLQGRHALGKLLRGNAQIQSHGGTGDGVLDAGLIHEGYLVVELLAPPYVSDRSSILHRLLGFHEESRLFVTGRPGYLLAAILHPTDTTAHDVAVGTVDHGPRVVHQFHLLHALLLHRTEVLLMSSTQAGEHADGGLDDIAQSIHLSWLTDAGFEDAQLRLFVEQPYGEGDADLRIVTAGRAHDALRGQEQLIEPLLDHRLAIGAGNAHHGDIELVAMAFGQSLQGCECRWHLQVVGICLDMFGQMVDYEIAHAPAIEVVDIAMAVVAL